MWSFTSWREGEIERDPELRAARALEALEGWPEDVRGGSSSSSPKSFAHDIGHSTVTQEPFVR